MSATRFIAAALLILPGTAIAQAPVRTIELSSFAYAPRTIALAAGKPITLAFVNRSQSSHDFTAKKFFANARIVSGAASAGEIELKGGQSVVVTLVPAIGRYKFHCSHFMHKQFGMSGEIMVR